MSRRVVGGLIQAATPEIFNDPYFCPSQGARWHDMAEPVPAPITEPVVAEMDLDLAEQLP